MKSIFTLPSYVGIILARDNEVLLVKRHNTDWASGNWNFPGGLLEQNESLLYAAAREAQEEIGVTIELNTLQLVHVLQVHKGSTNTKDILGFYFIAKNWQGTAINNEPDRHAEIGWFSVDNLPEHITTHALQALHGLQQGIYYSEN